MRRVKRQVGYNRLISNKCKKTTTNNKKILLDFADFDLQEQPEDNLMVAMSQTWCNGTYTMAAKPIKSLELQYAMIQFLLVIIIFDVSLPFLCSHLCQH